MLIELFSIGGMKLESYIYQIKSLSRLLLPILCPGNIKEMWFYLKLCPHPLENPQGCLKILSQFLIRICSLKTSELEKEKYIIILCCICTNCTLYIYLQFIACFLYLKNVYSKILSSIKKSVTKTKYKVYKDLLMFHFNLLQKLLSIQNCCCLI